MKEVREVKNPVQWRQQRPLTIHRCKAGRPTRVVFACDQWFGFHTHYHQERTMACPGADLCKICELGGESRWCGATVTCNESGTYFGLWLLTPAVATQMMLGKQPVNELYGQCWEFQRKTSAKTSELLCSYVGKGNLPSAKYHADTIATNVRRILGSSSLLKNVVGDIFKPLP